jgi:metallo-beta-lactamase class B
MESKFARANKGGGNPFIDPEGYKRYVADREQAFSEERKKQESAK